MFMSTIILKSRITNNNITNLRKKVTKNHPVVSNYGGKKFPTFRGRSVAAWLSETVLRGRGPEALVGSNPTEGGGFFRRKEPPPGHGCVCMSSRG
jgi:hypothetical protein